MVTVQGVKVVTDILRNHDNLVKPDEIVDPDERKLIRHAPSYPGVWVDIWGNVWTCIKLGKRFPCTHHLTMANAYVASRNRKVRVYSIPHERHYQVSVARLVLETWVGPRFPKVLALRIPFPGAHVPQPDDPTDWEFPDAPYHMHWADFSPADDLYVYLEHPEIFDRKRVWPLPEWDYPPIPTTGGATLKIRKTRYYTLREEYQKYGNPMAFPKGNQP